MALQLSASIPAFPSEDRRDAMKTTLRWTLTVGVVLVSGLAGHGHAAETASSETNSAITIHVKNYAGVAPKTLAEAKEVAAEIFRKAGVETRWADIVLATENGQENSAGQPACTLADIYLSIFPRVMSDRDGAPNNVMGVAPGSGPDRKIVYVFEGNVQTRVWELSSAHSHGRIDRQVSKAQVLGHVMAHEVGHLLLNQQVHSAHGIMRGGWELADFRDMTEGILLFTPQQAEFLQADVRRRNTQQEILKVTGLEYPAPAI
jgi:hypothetical protein